VTHLKDNPVQHSELLIDRVAEAEARWVKQSQQQQERIQQLELEAQEHTKRQKIAHDIIGDCSAAARMVQSVAQTVAPAHQSVLASMSPQQQVAVAEVLQQQQAGALSMMAERSTEASLKWTRWASSHAESVRKRQDAPVAAAAGAPAAAGAASSPATPATTPFVFKPMAWSQQPLPPAEKAPVVPEYPVCASFMGTQFVNSIEPSPQDLLQRNPNWGQPMERPSLPHVVVSAALQSNNAGAGYVPFERLSAQKQREWQMKEMAKPPYTKGAGANFDHAFMSKSQRDLWLQFDEHRVAGHGIPLVNVKEAVPSADGQMMWQKRYSQDHLPV
jgi:hypothetical protein